MDRVDRRKLHDELTEAFIEYQHRVDCPMPVDAKSESREAKIFKYQNDRMFHSRVDSLAAGVMNIIMKHID